MFSSQSPFDVRFEWGERRLDALLPECDVIVIVDVLSFSTCVDIAVSRGAAVLPHDGPGDGAAECARQSDTVLASRRNRTGDGYSLSPASLNRIPAGTRLLLPSPNGSTLSRRAGTCATVIAACLRNASAAAEFIRQRHGVVGVIACGERWRDGSLRPAWEDFVGAGAVIAGLSGIPSPEAEAARGAFRQAERALSSRLMECSSGRELVDRGCATDVKIAAEVDVSSSVPVLTEAAFVAHA